MPSSPSIKGSVFVAVMEDVRKVVSKGALSERELDRWLRPEDRKYLDEEILVSSWYDIGTYARMIELLRDVEGGGSNEYLREGGRRTARRLLESGLYAQLEYLHRIEVHSASGSSERFAAFGRDLRKLATLSGSILNFSRWTVKPEEDAARYRIEVSEAQDFPEVFCWRSDGFVNEMASRHGDDDLWRWERVSTDLIVFRMVRSL